MTDLNAVMRALKANSGRLTRQQIKTLRGQALKGDTDGASKGLERLLRRKEKQCQARDRSTSTSGA
jgi:hypothetical protein